jgi:hypothetical protein
MKKGLHKYYDRGLQGEKSKGSFKKVRADIAFYGALTSNFNKNIRESYEAKSIFFI